MKPATDSLDLWKQRLAKARTRRERYTMLWSHYSRMHTNAYRAVKEANDDAAVYFPNGDQVKAGLVFSNIEQTRAQLEVPEVGVRVEATDYSRELGAEDTHREAVIEQALYYSLNSSGLLKESEEVDLVKLDGTVIGHGINYTCWRVEEQEVETDRIPVLAEGEDGTFAPTDRFDPVIQRQTVWEGCQDETISPLQFLADAGCKKFDKASWLGFKRPTQLAALRADPRYTIPDTIVGTNFVIKDIYGDEGQEGEELTDAVMVIVIWDKHHREHLTYIETAPTGATTSYAKAAQRASRDPGQDLVQIGGDKWSVLFSHPDATPFSFYIPIPARDHPFGISQIEHVRNQASEADKLRTRQANITRQIKRIPWYNKKRVDQVQLEAALKSDDMVPVGLDIQDGEKPEQLFGELPVPSIHPDLYKQYTVAEEGVSKTSGVSDVPGGGADTATEAEYVFQIGGARMARKKRLYLKFLTSTASRHHDYLKAFCPEGEIMVVPDVDGLPLTLAYGRQAFVGKFLIEVVPGGGAMALSPVKQKMLIELSGQLKQQFGPAFDRRWLRMILTQFDVRGVNDLMRAAMFGMPPAGMAPGLPRPEISPNDITTGQTLRSAINAPSEG